ncbi:MAG: hypothetical protein ACTSQE_10870 [Candidatus Heimdallarchaeaceae archaeon]
MKQNIILYSLVMMLIISNVMNISLNSDIQQNDGTTQIETDSINSGYPEKSVINTQESYLQQSDLSDLQQSSEVVRDDSYKVNMATQTIDYTTWYQGETIRTEMKFNKQIPDYYTYTSELYHSGSTTPFEAVDVAIIGPGSSLKDDSSNTYITFSPDSDITIANYIRTTFYSKIYAGGSGALYAQGYARWYYSGSSYYSTSATSNSYTISTSYLDGSGYLHIYVSIYADDSADKLTLMIGFMNYETGSYVTVLQVEKTGCTSSNFHIATAVIDYLYFQRDEIVDNVRSTYKYTTQTTKIHKLEIYSIANVESISIYFPKYMAFSSISPTASYSLSSNTIVVNNPVELKYTFFFSSSNNYFLTLEDITSKYLTDIGFETGTYTHDYSSTSQAPTSIVVSTDIVSEGAYSLKFEDTEDVYTETFNYELSYRGRLYVSFDYYISSSTTNLDNFGIIYRIDDSTWKSAYVSDSTIRDRWCKAFFSILLLGDEAVNNRNLAIYFQNFKGLAYIDNVRFFISATSVNTIGFNQYEIFSKLISWDGYKNPAITEAELIFELWDKTNLGTQTTTAGQSDMLFRKIVMTDENGVGSCTVQQKITTNEYYIYAYNLENRFHIFPSSDVWDFVEDTENWLGMTVSLQFYKLLSQTPETAKYYDILYNSGADYAASEYYHLVFDIDEYANLDSNNYVYYKAVIDGTSQQVSANVHFYDNMETFYHFDLRKSSRYSGAITQLEIALIEQGSNLDGNEGFLIDYIYLYDDAALSAYSFTPVLVDSAEDPVLYEGSDYFYLSSSNNDFLYEIYSDFNLIGYYSDLEIIPKNMTAGDHNLTAVLYSDSQNQAYISSTYEYLYTITESELCTLTFYDQQGRYIDTRTFVIYVDGERIYGDTFLWTDTSATVNLEVYDIFGHTIYSNAAESYERFKDFVLTYYSVKIQNQQALPIWVSITSNGQTFSSWIFNMEVEEFHIYSGSYTFTVYYCDDPSASFTEVSTNGTYVSYSFTVSSDTALLVSGHTVSDIFGNTMSLMNDLELTNSSIHTHLESQTNNITIQIDNTNTNIDTQTNNIIIEITNTNSTLSQQLNTITTDIANLQTNITLQINDISSEINNLQTNITIQINDLNQAVINVQTNQTLQYNELTSLINNFESSMDSQLNSISVNIDNLQTNMTLQFNSIDTHITNIESNIVSQINNLETIINNFETSMDQQLNYLYLNITNLQSNITLQFNSISSQISNFQTNMTIQINDLNQTVINVQTNQTLQYNELTSLINNFESSMDSQLNSISVSINNLQTNITMQFNDISTQITNIESNIISQINNLETIINNFETSMDSQLNYLYLNITNLNSSITAQFNSISSQITNFQTNITIQINDLNQTVINVQTNQTLQYNELSTMITNFESNMDLQFNELNVTINNLGTNMTLQYNELSNQVYNVNSSLSSQINAIETMIINFESSMDTQINSLNISILNNRANITLQINDLDIAIENVHTEIITQANLINANLENFNTTIYNQTIAILNSIYNNNATIYNQTITLLNAISQTNSTLYQQSITVLNQIDLTNATQVQLILQTYEYLLDQENYFDVHFILTTYTGVGLDFMTAAIYVNGSQIYDWKQIYYLNTLLNVTVTDWFGNRLYQNNWTITSDTNIVLPVPLVEVILSNDNEVPVQLIFFNNRHNYTLPEVVNAHTNLTIMMFQGTYDVLIVPINTVYYNETHRIVYSNTTLEGEEVFKGKVLHLSTSIWAQPIGENLEETETEDPITSLERKIRMLTALLIAAITGIPMLMVVGWVIMNLFGKKIAKFAFDNTVGFFTQYHIDLPYEGVKMVKREPGYKKVARFLFGE